MTRQSAASKSHDVAIIGCGLMGSALARVLAGNGHSVVAWNRTPARSEALVPYGITPLESAAEAVAAASLVIACTSTYDSTRSSLEAAKRWDGTTLVNLATGTREEAEQMQRWTRERGGEYLDGAIFCYPREVGAPEAKFLFSGAESTWSRYTTTLQLFGGDVAFVSPQAGLANVILMGTAAFYIPAICSYVEAATYMVSQGLAIEAARASTLHALDNLRNVTEEVFAAIESGDHADDQATLDTYAEGLRTVQGQLRRVGQRAPILDAAMGQVEEARDAGLAELGISAQSKLLRS